MPLVAFKRAVLRLFLTSGVTDGTDVGHGPGVLKVDGEVLVTSAAGSARLPFYAMALPGRSHDRNEPAHSATVLLPTNLLQPGEVTIGVRASVSGHALDAPGGWSTRPFEHRLRFVTLRGEPLLPILVFNLLTEGNIARAIAGEQIGTLVTSP